MDRFKPVKASGEEIPILVRHHRNMFEEIYENRGLVYDEQMLHEMDLTYAEKLEKEMSADKCFAWLVKADEQVVSSGTVSLVSIVPTPNDPSPTVCYIHSLFTEPEYRYQGCAKLIMEVMIDFCKEMGIKRILLHASDAGKPLYEKLGFRLSDNAMSILVE